MAVCKDSAGEFPFELLPTRPQTILAFMSTPGVSFPREQEFNQRQTGLKPMEVFFLIIVAAIIAIFLAMLRSSPADRLRSRGMMGGFFMGGDSDMSGPTYTPPMNDTDPNWPHHHHQPGDVAPAALDPGTDQSGGYQGGPNDTSLPGGSYDSGSSGSGGFDSGASGGGSDSGGCSSSGSDGGCSSGGGGGDCG